MKRDKDRELLAILGFTKREHQDRVIAWAKAIGGRTVSQVLRRVIISKIGCHERCCSNPVAIPALLKRCSKTP